MISAQANSFSAYREKLWEKVAAGDHLIGVAAGSGMTAKYMVMGGCDMLLALSSGRYRSMGLGSLAGFMCYANSNDMVMDYARQELLRYSDRVPVFFGLNATDPTKEIYQYIKAIRSSGFTGVVNYPTIGMIDGRFREMLEGEGISYAKEVEAISFAHYCGLLTLAFVFDASQARQMIRAGADIICAHFGLTSGGYVGAKKVLTLEEARVTACKIFSAVDAEGGAQLKMVYGGPVKNPIDAEYIYMSSGCQGYVGGSAFERTPIESMLLHVIDDYKKKTQLVPSNQLERILYAGLGNYNYIDFVLEYINENYMNKITLNDLAQSVHLSVSYLSTLFKKSVGRSFKSYLINLRMKKAETLIRTENYPLVQVASMVGYQDYAHFSKIYKKIHGVSPRETSQNQKQTQE